VTKHTVSELDDPPRVVIDIAGRPASASERAAGAVATGETRPDVAPDAARTDGASAEATRNDTQTTRNETETTRNEAQATRDETATRNEIQTTRNESHAARTETQGTRTDTQAASAEADLAPRGSGARAESTAPANTRGDTAQPGNRPDASRAVSAFRESGGTNRTRDGEDRNRIAAVTPDERTGADQSGPRLATKEETAASSTDPSRGTAAEKRKRAPSVPRRIVLDPGHGGNDPGAEGVDGVLEKHVTLAIAKKLKRRLEEGMRAEVVLTRTSDATRSLAERTAFANARGADLFISIHANADAAGRLHGIETYTLNNSDDRATIRLAKMENGPAFRTPRGNLSFILSDLVQSGKEEESNALAERLQYRMLSRLRTHYPDVRDLGVKKGPFYVLVGAYMPCVLVETSFLSHPVEGRRLASEEYQTDLVEGLYLGVADFFGDARLAKTL
jgi:N-acetylmuramoyl-L-alanine amidase